MFLLRGEDGVPWIPRCWSWTAPGAAEGGRAGRARGAGAVLAGGALAALCARPRHARHAPLRDSGPTARGTLPPTPACEVTTGVLCVQAICSVIRKTCKVERGKLTANFGTGECSRLRGSCTSAPATAQGGELISDSSHRAADGAAARTQCLVHWSSATVCAKDLGLFDRYRQIRNTRTTLNSDVCAMSAGRKPSATYA